MGEARMSNEIERGQFVQLTADIVSAYLSKNHVRMDDLPDLIGSIHQTLKGLATGQRADAAPTPIKATAQAIKRSITPDHLVSFEDGRPYKTLKRHLRTLGLTTEEYRRKWGLPLDYPMTAQAYSEKRSEVAKSIGLGVPRRSVDASSPPIDRADLAEAAEQDGSAAQGETKHEIDDEEIGQDGPPDELTREPFEDDGLPGEV